MNHRLNITLFLLMSGPSVLLAQNNPNYDYQDRQYLGNIAYGSSNPVTLHYMPITDLADIHISYRHKDGEFHLIDQGNASNLWEGSFSGMKRIGKVTFGGSLVYHNLLEKDRRWNNTLFVSGNNPFVIADSLRSDFSTETFHLDGGAAFQPNEKWILALKANYEVGSSATQKDPRPEIKGMRFRITPGAEYNFGNHAIGVSANIEWLSEEVTHTVVKTTTKQYVFLFQGLGVYEARDAVGYRRKYNGTLWGAQLQYSFNNNPDAAVGNFLQVAYRGETEDATDGNHAEKYKGGKYIGTTFSFQDRLQWRYSPNTIHNFTLSASAQDVTGRWYTQQQSTDAAGNLIYQVINESDNLQAHILNASAGYRFDRLLHDGRPSFQGELKASLVNSETKNKIYGAKETYTNAIVDISATKRFLLKKGQISANLNAGVCMNMEKSINLSGMPATYSPIMERYTRPAFIAEAAGYWQGGAGMTYSLPISILGYPSVMEIGVDGFYRRISEKSAGIGNDRYGIGAHFGFIF